MKQDSIRATHKVSLSNGIGRIHTALLVDQPQVRQVVHRDVTTAVHQKHGRLPYKVQVTCIPSVASQNRCMIFIHVYSASWIIIGPRAMLTSQQVLFSNIISILVTYDYQSHFKVDT